MRLRFRKMHGLGNDFVVLDARKTPLALTSDQVRFLADRHTGIGCDQLIVLESSPVADIRMRIWNPDGGEVEACGNAARCVATIAGDGASIQSGGGIIRAEVAGGGVTVDMGLPRFDWDEIPLAYPMDTAHMPVGWSDLDDPAAVNVGNPHIVFFVDDADEVMLDELGPIIEHDPLFPDRINVGIAAVNDGAVTLRVWERGAGLTRACGTAACAAAVVAIRRGLAASPVTVELPGGRLEIAWAPGETIRMTGPATHVFDGEIEL